MYFLKYMIYALFFLNCENRVILFSPNPQADENTDCLHFSAHCAHRPVRQIFLYKLLLF